MAAARSPVLRIYTVRLRVRDLRRSVAFYRELLGLQEKPGAARNGKACECVVEDAHHAEFGIMFSRGLTDDVLPGSLQQISFEVSTVEEAAAVYKKAREMGAQAIQPRLHEGGWRTVVFDPDGHRLEVLTRNTEFARGNVG